MSGDRTDRRYHADQGGELGDVRDSFRKDHDRLYYTPSFRRLTGVTQVASPQSEVALIHNRYIHSDKVAQIGRSIAEYLLDRTDPATIRAVGDVHPDVVAAAGLAHDIGHPPFGHMGERVLHRIALDWGIDGFEGNAQTFRVLTKLAVKNETYPGLDLTSATRNAVLKYPWTYGQGPTPELVERHRRKWCVYRTEVPDFEQARSVHVLPPGPDGEASQSVEASLMEFADDISYALHDFEDFYRVGLISIAELRRSAGLTSVYESLLESVKRALTYRFDYPASQEAWDGVRKFLDTPMMAMLVEPYRGALEQDAALVRFTSYQISRFTDGLSIKGGEDHPLVIDPIVEHEVAIWKELTRQFVIQRPAFGAVQMGQGKVVKGVAMAIREWIEEEGINSPRLPQRLVDYYRLGIFDGDDPTHPNPSHDKVVSRAVIDFVASLTEPQLTNLYDQLHGSWRSTMIGKLHL